MAGFENQVLVATNVNFDPGSPPNNGQVTSDGQLLIGSTASPNIKVGNLTSSGGSLNITNGSGTINLEVAGGSTTVTKLNVQAGTSPVVPSSGAITLNGAVVAGGTTPIRTNGTGANTAAVEVQFGQAVAATDATKVGLLAMASNAFNVDASGFVTLRGGGQAVDSFQVDSVTAPGVQPVQPATTGLVTFTGAQVSSGTVGANVVRTQTGALNTMAVQIQQSGSAAAQDTTLNGVAHFNSGQFTVASGFVSAKGGGLSWTNIGASQTLAVNTGYFCSSGGALSLALPATSAVGDVIVIVLDGSTSWTITQGAGQQIRLGNQTTTLGVGGSLASTAQGDCIYFVCRTANTLWTVINSIGNITVV